MSFLLYDDFYHYLERLTTLSATTLSPLEYSQACQHVIDHLDDSWTYRALEELHHQHLAHRCADVMPDLFAIMLRSLFVGRPLWTSLQDAVHDIFGEHPTFLRSLGWTHREWFDGQGCHRHLSCSLAFTPDEALFLSQWHGFHDIWNDPRVKRPPVPTTAVALLTYYDQEWPYLLPFEQERFDTFSTDEQEKIAHHIVPIMMNHPAFTVQHQPRSLAFGSGYHRLFDRWCQQPPKETPPLLQTFVLQSYKELLHLSEYHSIYQYLPIPVLEQLYVLGYIPEGASLDHALLDDFHHYQCQQSYTHAWPMLAEMSVLQTMPYTTVVDTWIDPPTLYPEISLEL